MLLVCGPVTKQHFLAAGGTALGGAALIAASFVLETPRAVPFGGWMLVVIGGCMLLAFGFMWSQYGFREPGGTQTVYACQFCGNQFGTYQQAEMHERCCPLSNNAGGIPMGGGPSIVGVPVGQQNMMQGTPMGTVVQPMGTVVQPYNQQPYNQQVPMGQAVYPNQQVVQATVVR